MQHKIFKVPIAFDLISEHRWKLFKKNKWDYFGWSKIGEESITKGILFKGSVSVISSITCAVHWYTETVVGALIEEVLRIFRSITQIFSDDWNINTSKIGLILDNWSIHRSREINDYFVNHDINKICILNIVLSLLWSNSCFL